MLRRLALILALSLVAAACVTQAEPTTTTAGSAVTVPGNGGPTTTLPGTTTSTAPLPTPTTPDLSGLEGVSDEVRAQLERLLDIAQKIRELPFVTPPQITVVSDDELEQRVRDLIAEDAEDFPADDALYTLLGLLPPDADLETVLVDLYGEQVAGFYDGETQEIVVPARRDGFTLLQQGTMVHELTHAVVDQHFDFNTKYRAMIDGDRFDEATAYQALIEGDATLAEVLWAQSLSRRQLGEFVAQSQEVDQSALQAAPKFIRDSLIFPYDTGFAFVQRRYDSGGWEAVNELYEMLPSLPPSSEQVITSSDLGRDLPIPVEPPEIELQGYDLVRTSTWGEAGLRIMLDQVLGESVAVKAADGWGGDAYLQWFDGENAAFLLVYAGDTQREVDELKDALVDYALTAVAEEDFVWVEEIDDLLYFIAADEVEAGATIRTAIGSSAG
ncbi:MAG: hypothetical protein ACE5F5_08045 [Acidimicrobiia bacterium]